MEPRTFCDALNREAGDYLLATVLEGAAQGAQLLLCGGVPVWPEHPAACLEAQLPALQQVTASGVQTFGALRVFAERFGAAPRLVVCGGGHVGASVVRLAKLLGLPVCALEDRPEFVEQLRQAGADPVLCLPFEEGLAAVSGGAECYFVVVTRAHSCVSFGDKKIALPPNCPIPVSNEIRVRVDDFSNIMPSVRPTKG